MGRDETEKILSGRRASQIMLALDQAGTRSTFRAWRTKTPAIMAFVVAMAGMMLPAYSGGGAVKSQGKFKDEER